MTEFREEDVYAPDEEGRPDKYLANLPYLIFIISIPT